MPERTIVSLLVAALILLPQLAWPDEGAAFSNLKIGVDLIENVTLPTIDGKRADLLDHGQGANVFIYFRPEAEPSRLGLGEMGRCAERLAGYPVRWVGLVSDRHPVEDVKAMVAAAGFRGPVLIDRGNALYGKFGVRLHPVAGVTDGKGLLTAYQPFTQINFCARVEARVLHTLGEIDDGELARRLEPGAVNPREKASVAARNLRLAERFIQLGDYDQALAAARRSLELAPERTAAHGVAALALANLQQCDAATVHIEQALAGDSGDENALTARQKCER